MTAPSPALEMQLSIVLPSTTPEQDIDRAKMIVEKLREYGPDASIHVDAVRWSKS